MRLPILHLGNFTVGWHCRADSPSDLMVPEGPSTQYLRLLVPKTIPSLVLGPGSLNVGYLDPLGVVAPRRAQLTSRSGVKKLRARVSKRRVSATNTTTVSNVDALKTRYFCYFGPEKVGCLQIFSPTQKLLCS